MVSTQQQNAFFTQTDQMGLSAECRAQLKKQGIAKMEDMDDWKDEEWRDFKHSCYKPGDKVTGTTVSRLASIELSVGSYKKLRVMSLVCRHYRECGRTIEAEMMKFNLVGEIFELQNEAAQLLSKKEDPPVPLLMSMKVFSKWWEAIVSYFSQKYGVRNIPLTWIIRDDAIPPNPLPDLEAGKPHTDGKSIIDDAVAFFDHRSPLYNMDNNLVYSVLDLATRGSAQAATVKPFGKNQNGRGAALALVAAHLGDSKWDQIIQDAEAVIARPWDGSGSCTLQTHIDRVTAAYVEIESAAEHVNHQVPDERTRVSNLLKSIEKCEHSNISAARALINQPNSLMREDFELSCRNLLPSCPVAARFKNKKQSVTIAAVGGSLEQKVTASGLEVRYYDNTEWWELTDDQRADISRLRTTGTATPSKKSKFERKQKHKKTDNSKFNIKKNFKRQVSSAVKKHVLKQSKVKAEKEDSLSQIAGIISALGSRGESAPPPRSSVTKETRDDLAMAAAVKINKILKST